MDSKIALIIQFSGVLFVAALMFLLTQSLKSVTLTYWKKSWLSLSISLISLQIAFGFTDTTKPFIFLYYLGEYVFGYFLIAGCHRYSTGNDLPKKSWLFLIPSVFLAFFLTFSTSDFNNVLNFHSLVIGTIFIFAFLSVKSNKLSSQNLGLRVMRFSLALLAIDFYHFTFLLSFTKGLFAEYLTFNPIIDLMLEILLGFGMIIVLLERVRYQIEEANHKLKEAHEKLEHLVQTDPLTTAFNRHAFYGFLKKRGTEEIPISGCVGFFDIDDLKPINDQLGHAVGDAVIRQVTTAIRTLMRAEDLLFRWGGDEFFVIMVSMESDMARERMKGLTKLLQDVQLFGTSERLSISVSFGFTDFADSTEIEKAVKSADEEMYRIKEERKRPRPSANFIPKTSEPTRLTA